MSLLPSHNINRLQCPPKSDHGHREPWPTAGQYATTRDAQATLQQAVEVRISAVGVFLGTNDASAVQHRRIRIAGLGFAGNHHRRIERTMNLEEPTELLIARKKDHPTLHSPINPMFCSISSILQRVTRRLASVIKRST